MLRAEPKYPGTGVTPVSVTLTIDPSRSACSPTVALEVANGFIDATSAVVHPFGNRSSKGSPSASST